MELTQERLKELVVYNSETGEWSGNCSFYPGSVYPYNRLYIDGKIYRSGRLAFFYMTGEWPLEEVDHINGDPTDDCWANLRKASRSQNMANRGKWGKSGLPKGVSKYGNKYRAACGYKGKEIYLGMFSTVEEASQAYQNKVEELHGEYIRQ